MNTDQIKTKIELINEFLKLFGDDLDACHPDAYDLLDQVNSTPSETHETILRFNKEFSEEIEACYEDAYQFYSDKIATV